MSDFSQLPPVEYEKQDVEPRSISRTALFIAVVTAFSALVAWAYVRTLLGRDVAARPALPAVARHEAERQPPAPRLQRAPFDDVRALRLVEDRWLAQYRWVDKPAGVTRIPIEEAMRLYAQRASGRPAAPAAGGEPEAPR